MEIKPDNLPDTILNFCLTRAPSLEGISFDLLGYFAKKVADEVAARDGFGFVEAEKSRVQIALAELERDKYISPHQTNYLLTASGRIFAERGGYAGQKLRVIKTERTMQLDRWITRSMAGVALAISIITLFIKAQDVPVSQSAIQPPQVQQVKVQKQLDSLKTPIDTSKSVHPLERVRH